MAKDRSDSYNVIIVPQDRLEFVWPKVIPFFTRVLEHNGDYTNLEALYRGLTSDSSSKLIVIINTNDKVMMAVICEVMECPSGKRVLMIPHLAGVDMSEWLPMLVETFYDIAKKLNCFKTMIAGGRAGWEKVMKPYGGKLSHIVVEFDTDEYFKGKDNGR